MKWSAIAQSVEQVTVNHRVGGSSPSCGAKVFEVKSLIFKDFFSELENLRYPVYLSVVSVVAS